MDKVLLASIILFSISIFTLIAKFVVEYIRAYNHLVNIGAINTGPRYVIAAIINAIIGGGGGFVVNAGGLYLWIVILTLITAIILVLIYSSTKAEKEGADKTLANDLIISLTFFGLAIAIVFANMMWGGNIATIHFVAFLLMIISLSYFIKLSVDSVSEYSSIDFSIAMIVIGCILVVGGIIMSILNNRRWGIPRLYIATIGSTLIGILLLIFGSIAYVKIHNKAHPPKPKPGPETSTPIPNICPNNSLSQNDVETILKRFNRLYTSNGCGTAYCDEILQQFYASVAKHIANPPTGSDATIESEVMADIDEILDNMGSGSGGQQNLLNQAKYLLYQLFQCTTTIPLKSVSTFGTVQWITDNMLSNSISSVLYIVSVIIMTIFIIFNFISVKSELLALGSTRPMIILTSFIVVALVIFFLIRTFQYFNEQNQTQYIVPPHPPKLNKYFSQTTPVLPESFKFATTTTLVYVLFGIIAFALFFLYRGALISSPTKLIAISILLAVIVSFNTYFMVAVPQLVIIGVVLQWLILQTPDDADNVVMSSVIKAVMFGFIIFASFYDTLYKPNNVAPNTAGVATIYNQYVWMLFVVVSLIFMLNAVDYMYLNSSFVDGNEKRFSLILMPIVAAILNKLDPTQDYYDILAIKL